MLRISRSVYDRARESAPRTPRGQLRKSGRILFLLATVFVALPVAGCVDAPPAQTEQNESAGEPSTGHHTITVTDATFQSEVLANEQLVLVDIWAPWCSYCLDLAPIVEEIAAAYEGRVTVAKLNSDENPGVVTRYDVTGLPTLLLIRDGQVVETMRGYHTKQELAAKLDALLASE